MTWVTRELPHRLWTCLLTYTCLYVRSCFGPVCVIAKALGRVWGRERGGGAHPNGFRDIPPHPKFLSRAIQTDKRESGGFANVTSTCLLTPTQCGKHTDFHSCRKINVTKVEDGWTREEGANLTMDDPIYGNNSTSIDSSTEAIFFNSSKYYQGNNILSVEMCLKMCK